MIYVTRFSIHVDRYHRHVVSFSELKDIFNAVVLKKCSIIVFACFIAFSSAAPAQQVEDGAVLTWLKNWNGQLEQSAGIAFRKYVSSLLDNEEDSFHNWAM